VNDVVVLQKLRNQPETVEHSMLAVDRPRVWDSDQTARHVNQAPATQAPENSLAEPDSFIGKPDDAAENQHDYDVEDELRVPRRD